MASPSQPIHQLGAMLKKHMGMFDKVPQAIQDSKVAMETQLGAIQVETGLLQADHTKLVAREAEVELTPTSLRSTMMTVQGQLKTLQAKSGNSSCEPRTQRGARDATTSTFGVPREGKGRQRGTLSG
ncbi:hypothetical protein NDU88_005194 [Pleurodeles waltl]|uniref:Uncharacterized protein n=1 Tax=Pleurodeles waltl TaxID=8319 RepID=A0AAV7LNF2_PLEWA|nr:hypothetical protein NDU88_005194 [Pleurodeles waltl]